MKTWPCVSGAHRGHTSRTQAAACAEDAERLRRLEERQIEAFDAECEEDDDE